MNSLLTSEASEMQEVNRIFHVVWDGSSIFLVDMSCRNAMCSGDPASKTSKYTPDAIHKNV